MTTDLPPGPELDRKVAEAMGKPLSPCDGDFAWWDDPHQGAHQKCTECGAQLLGEHFDNECHPRQLAGYSTDDSTQAEKLAWLSENAVNLVIWKSFDGRWYVERSTGDYDIERSGTTIQHALALLVCAVHEREKGAK
jgi:hypothetical protein